MSQPISLKEAEQKVFRVAYNDGLMDILLACFFLMFVIAPYLSPSMGDFWASAVFLPFWALAFLAIWLIRKFVVIPRIGKVKFGQVRKAKLMKFTLGMLVINTIALVLGIVAAFTIRQLGYLFSILLGIQLLIFFSLGGYFLNMNRLYVYGFLATISQPVGEWLFQHGLASHHGYPITFGTISGIMVLVGLIIFVRLLIQNPLPENKESLREE